MSDSEQMRDRAGSQPGLPTGPLHVICVDDDPDILLLLQITIDAQPDFELVATTTDASAALALVRAHHPDVVILDHVLRTPARLQPDHPRSPRLEFGHDLIETARTIVPDAIIVMFTGADGIRDSAHDAGADLFIAKPDLDALWSAIRELRSNTEPRQPPRTPENAPVTPAL